MPSKKQHLCEKCGEIILNRFAHARMCKECAEKRKEELNEMYRTKKQIIKRITR